MAWTVSTWAQRSDATLMRYDNSSALYVLRAPHTCVVAAMVAAGQGVYDDGRPQCAHRDHSYQTGPQASAGTLSRVAARS